MDHWDSYSRLRAQAPDAIRRWANLEGKSATMRDDLYRRCFYIHARHATGPRLHVLAELVTWLHVTWWLVAT